MTLPAASVVVGIDNGATSNNATVLEDSGRFLVDDMVESPSRVKEGTEAALDALEVDHIGLDQTDRNLLLTIIQKFDGGPVGLDTLAASTSEDSETIEDVYEPYLLQLGFIARTPRGRIVTRFAYKHLGLDAPQGGNGLGPGLWQSITPEKGDGGAV